MTTTQGRLKLLDLFSGIGGFSLGLERTGGFETVAFCEIEPFPRKILNKHWPEVPCYEDIRDLTAARLRGDGISIEAICGGFPCQDISAAGNKAGLTGKKSSLWLDLYRLVEELRPRVLFMENSSELRHRGLGDILEKLASIGYDCQWHCIPACYAGADHLRDRLWLIADLAEGYGQHNGRSELNTGEVGEDLSDPHSARKLQSKRLEREVWRWLSDSFERAVPAFVSQDLPVLGREVHGIPGRIHRIAALGNAVVPQIPELLGNAYLESIGWRSAA